MRLWKRDDVIDAEFARNGSAVLRAAIALKRLAAMRKVFAQLVPHRDERRRRDGILKEVTGAKRTHAVLDAIACDPKFGALAAEALGARRVQLLQDSLLYKPAYHGGAVEWHQDYTYVAYLAPPRVVTIRIPLDCEDELNGCMRVVDGSHKWGLVGRMKVLQKQRVTSLVGSLDAAQRAAVDRARPLVLAPGDVSVHHCLTLHSSTPNRSDRARRTIILRMFDADCCLVVRRLPKEARRYFPADNDGHLAVGAFPLVHGRKPAVSLSRRAPR
jgi:ectoine hydroxylase-related dioxygenase (phytanoyl-CoA dioxygenase family)